MFSVVGSWALILVSWFLCGTTSRVQSEGLFTQTGLHSRIAFLFTAGNIGEVSFLWLSVFEDLIQGKMNIEPTLLLEQYFSGNVLCHSYLFTEFNF